MAEKLKKENLKTRFNELLEAAKPFLEKTDYGVEHTERVLQIAKKNFEIPREGEELLIISIILHDVGGNTIEKQYQNGPQIARRLLRQFGYAENFIMDVCEIIRTHHERLQNPSEAFRILYDADQLVKFSPEEFQSRNSRNTDWTIIVNKMYYTHSKTLAKKFLKKRKS
jgi:hypothetical protein